MDQHFYEPRLGHGLPHDPFKAIVAPRPIGWVTTISAEGKVNLAPYSFFNAFNSNPPIVGFASEGRKDSLRNVEATGEFVCNLATRPLAEVMNRCSAPLPHGESEMEFAGIESAPSRLVRPPRVANTPAALECKVTQIVQFKTAEGRDVDTYLVLGEVIGVHIDRAYLKDGIFDLKAARPIGRAGYRGDYAEMGEMFEMFRPTKV
ncbi:flavin reductase family protein [Roseomonas chloroacetimidivorans]|jgi:flavin reductase (DIM6/NTAB) family NADH-FMN oxidoreductase RutF|uniref:flavin reductase family protein n=1 Tax=Roseomonas chloroacetimidivorans TaxID=1766656 RepID=UPI003C73968B